VRVLPRGSDRGPRASTGPRGRSRRDRSHADQVEVPVERHGDQTAAGGALHLGVAASCSCASVIWVCTRPPSASWTRGRTPQVLGPGPSEGSARATSGLNPLARHLGVMGSPRPRRPVGAGEHPVSRSMPVCATSARRRVVRRRSPWNRLTRRFLRARQSQDRARRDLRSRSGAPRSPVATSSGRTSPCSTTCIGTGATEVADEQPFDVGPGRSARSNGAPTASTNTDGVAARPRRPGPLAGDTLHRRYSASTISSRSGSRRGAGGTHDQVGRRAAAERSRLGGLLTATFVCHQVRRRRRTAERFCARRRGWCRCPGSGRGLRCAERRCQERSRSMAASAEASEPLAVSIGASPAPLERCDRRIRGSPRCSGWSVGGARALRPGVRGDSALRGRPVDAGHQDDRRPRCRVARGEPHERDLERDAGVGRVAHRRPAPSRVPPSTG
jgi:hypothetical protein